MNDPCMFRLSHLRELFGALVYSNIYIYIYIYIYSLGQVCEDEASCIQAAPHEKFELERRNKSLLDSLGWPGAIVDNRGLAVSRYWRLGDPAGAFSNNGAVLYESISLSIYMYIYIYIYTYMFGTSSCGCCCCRRRHRCRCG